MAQTKKWRLDPKEVESSSTGTTAGGRRKLRQSRTLDERSLRICLKHSPTGVIVEGTIPHGNYSRKMLRTKSAKLYASLFRELEVLVAQTLRLPGR